MDKTGRLHHTRRISKHGKWPPDGGKVRCQGPSSFKDQRAREACLLQRSFAVPRGVGCVAVEFPLGV